MPRAWRGRWRRPPTLGVPHPGERAPPPTRRLAADAMVQRRRRDAVAAAAAAVTGCRRGVLAAAGSGVRRGPQRLLAVPRLRVHKLSQLPSLMARRRPRLAGGSAPALWALKCRLPSLQQQPRSRRTSPLSAQALAQGPQWWLRTSWRQQEGQQQWQWQQCRQRLLGRCAPIPAAARTGGRVHRGLPCSSSSSSSSSPRTHRHSSRGHSSRAPHASLLRPRCAALGTCRQDKAKPSGTLLNWNHCVPAKRVKGTLQQLCASRLWCTDRRRRSDCGGG